MAGLRPDEALQQALLQEVDTLYANRRPPPYVAPLLSYDAVRFVMVGARKVLQELGLEAACLDRMPFADITPYWLTVIRDVEVSTTIWAPLDVGDTLELLIRRLAGDAYAMWWQSIRYTKFLSEGAPPGVQELPAYSNRNGQKSYAVANRWWQVPGKSWAAYVSCSASGIPRAQSLRASHCTALDEFNARAFV